MLSGLMSRCTTPWLWARAQGIDHLAGDLQRIGERQLFLPIEPVTHALALDVVLQVLGEIERGHPAATVRRLYPIARTARVTGPAGAASEN